MLMSNALASVNIYNFSLLSFCNLFLLLFIQFVLISKKKIEEIKQMIVSALSNIASSVIENHIVAV
jgi:hypothetical protein